jgi:ubiquinone biosynthesis protein COQ4
MTTETAIPSGRSDWRGALIALRRLMADASDTTQAFRIMRALNAPSLKAGYARLLSTRQGGRIAYRRVELAERFSDPAYVAQFGADTVGGAYAAFLRKTGFSADGLAMVSRQDDPLREAEHPLAWYGRRMRDTHDIWHILTGYPADAPLGEAGLAAFTYGQTRGRGWALVTLGVAFRALRVPQRRAVWAALWEGLRNGRRAAWLPGEDYETLLSEPLAEARDRLGIAHPKAYWALGAIR